MATNYPGALDSLSNPTYFTAENAASYYHDVQHANANDAIEAVQGELGTDPAGGQVTVKARLDEWAATGIPMGRRLWRSQRWVDTRLVVGGQVTSYADVNTVYYMPWFCPRTVTVDRVAINVASNPLAGSSVALALYDTTTDYLPGAGIANFGTLNLTTSGAKEWTVSLAVTAGKLYWFGLWNGAFTVAYDVTGSTLAATQLSASTSFPGSSAAAYMETAATMPATASASLTTTSTNYVIYLRRA